MQCINFNWSLVWNKFVGQRGKSKYAWLDGIRELLIFNGIMGFLGECHHFLGDACSVEGWWIYLRNPNGSGEKSIYTHTHIYITVSIYRYR